jgi:hypothetical protein
MHCDCCDKLLSDWESSLRSVTTDEYMNTCWKCLQGLNIEVKGNMALKRKRDESLDEIEEDIEPYIQKQSSDIEWEDD